MTDTGQVPGEGLPADAGAVDQPGAPAPGAYTYLDPAVAPAPDEDDLLLMPGAQGAWSEGQPAPAHAAPAYGTTGYEQAPFAAESMPYAQVPQPAYAQAPPAAPGNPQAGPYAPAPHEPGPHEASGRDSGSVNLAEVRAPAPAPAAPATPSNGTPRRPLHLGPPSSGSGAGPVRSLADRGPAGAPPQPVQMQETGPPTVGPEYLDVPSADHGVPQQGPQSGEIPLQGAVPWDAQPQPPQGPHVPGAETVVPDASQGAAAPWPPHVPQPVAQEPVAEPVPAPGPAQGEPYAVAEAPPSGPVALPVEVAQPQPVVAAVPGAPTASAEPSYVEQPVGQFVPVAGQIPSTPHLAPTPPQPLRIPQEDAPVEAAAAAGAAPEGAPPESVPPEPVQPDAVQPDPAQSEQQPVAAQTVAEQALPAQPVAEQPVPAQPVAEAPGADQPGAEQPVAEQPVAEQQLAGQQPLPAVVPAELPDEGAVAGAEQAEAIQAPGIPVPEEAPVAEAPVPAEAPVDPAPEDVAEAAPAADVVDVVAVTVPAPRVGETEGPAADENPQHVPEAEAENEIKTDPATEPEAVAPVADPEAEAAEPASAPDPADAPVEPAAEPVTAEVTPAEPDATPVATQATAPVAEAEQPAVPGGSESESGAGSVDDAEPIVAEEGAEAAVLAGALAPAPAYDEAEREAVLRVMRERRDIRNGFRSDPIPHDVLLRVLEAAHTAPSVGHSQPWDFVVIRSADTRRTMHELAMRQKDAYAKSLPKGRAKQFKELKIEAILDTPVNIVVTADPTRGGRHTLGRHTQPQMAPYSSALAVENLWLAARAEGLGVGWVSFFDEREMVRTLGLPEHLEVVAYLCVGYVDEFPAEPELMQAGWSKRRPLSWVVHEETYGRRALPGEEPHDLLAETVANIRPLDAKALGEAWERQKRMTKPAGALGMLEIISAQLSGLSRMCPPPIPEPAAVAIFAGDHGVHAQGVTPWPQEVTGQMVANFLGGGAVCNAFANQVGAEVCIIDVGVASDLPATPGLLPRKVRAGTADMTTGPALTREEVKEAIEVGIDTARDLVAAGNKALLTGEMGIANTTASAALISVFTGADPAEVTGRGTGVNDETLARKTDVVRRALELHQPDPADPVGVLAAIGGLEHAAMVGLLLGGASLRTPVILDGVSAGAAALVARAIAPEVLAACIAGHRSAEPGHVAALNKLGLRPLVDLDLRLGEGTGALLALPVVQSAARAMHEVATFDSAGVTEK